MTKKITNLMFNGENYEIREYQEGGGWQPGANTIAYYPLDATNTVNDLSGNNYTLTGNYNYDFGTYGDISCCYINVGSLKANISDITDSSGYTVSIWYYEVSTPNYDNGLIAAFCENNSQEMGSGIMRANGRPNSKQGVIGYYGGTDVGPYSTTAYNTDLGKWNCYCYTTYNGTSTLYINGTSYATMSVDNITRNMITISRRDFLDRSIKGYVSNAIFEDKARTAQEVSDYYNQTKSNYGIS